MKCGCPNVIWVPTENGTPFRCPVCAELIEPTVEFIE